MKKTTKVIGEEHEALAREYLKGVGYSIVESNYRFSKLEIDIIAKHESTLIFIEVKMRSYNYFGQPEEFVSEQKACNITTAALEYIETKNWKGPIRFDIISIINSKKEIRHFKDAFY